MKDFLWSVAISKGIKKGIQVLIAFVAAKAAEPALKEFGVSVSIDPTAATVAIMAFIESARNWAKMKGPGWVSRVL